MKKYSINQKYINIVLFTIVILIIYLIIYSSVNIRNSMDDEQLKENDRSKCVELSKTLEDTSDYLTDSVRKFVATRDRSYLNGYWDEIEKHKNRDKAIEELINMNIPLQEQQLITLAKEYSDLLIDSETKAMRLILDTMEINEEELPDRVKNYKLNVVEEKLSNQEKVNKAIDLVFGESYMADKNIVINSISVFQKTLTSRLEYEVKASRNETIKSINFQNTLLGISVMLLIIVLYIFYTFFTYPIKKYTETLKKNNFNKENSRLEPRGSSELRLFAEKFNILYEDLIKASRAKDEFLATMSHEIRTPLNTVLGYIDLLDNTKLDEKQSKYLKRSKLASKNLLQIINNILDFSKLEKNKFEREDINFNLLEYLDEIKQVFTYTAKGKGIYFNIEIQDNFPKRLSGDITKLSQVLINLISNAIKFTNEGGVTLSIFFKKLEDSKLHLIFKVKDTGIGIKEKDKDRIFKAFEQSDVSITREYGGTGLGLAISKMMIEVLNGSINVESIYGEGSIFTIELDMEIRSEKSNDFEENKLNNIYFKDIRVLLVDDNDINREMEKELLENYGLVVACASSGYEAIDKAEKEKFNVVFMDIRMKGMDGYETSRMIRRGYNRFIYIIALTADVVEDVYNKVIDSGMNDILTKPINMDHLIDMLKRRFVNKYVYYKKEFIEEESVLEAKYINFNEGIERLSGNKTLYLEILQKFYNQYSNDINKVGKLIHNKEYEKVLDILHTLKGLCGTIGANNMRVEILAFEALLKNNKYENIDVYIKVLNKVFSKTLLEINEYIELNKYEMININPKIDDRSIDREEIKDFINKLVNSLKEGNISSINLFLENEFMLKNIVDESDFNNMKLKLNEYDFDGVLEILKQVVKKYV